MIFKQRALMHKFPAPQKKAKNIIKTKRSLVLFSLFVSAIDWSAFFLFQSAIGCWLDGWPNHQYYSVNGLRDCYWLVRIVFVK